MASTPSKAAPVALVVLEASDVLEAQVAQVAIALVAVASVAPADSKLSAPGWVRSIIFRKFATVYY